jgi:ADP-ribosyl-[dinitrogen reductase] hydrolase
VSSFVFPKKVFFVLFLSFFVHNAIFSIDQKTLERSQGALLGLAAGDSLGVPGENIHADAGRALGDPTKNPPKGPITDMATRGQRVGFLGFQGGQWTDDTSMAMALADYLLMLPQDQAVSSAGCMKYFYDWIKTGKYACSSTKYPTLTKQNVFQGQKTPTGPHIGVISKPAGWANKAAAFYYEQNQEGFSPNNLNKNAKSNGCLMRLAPAVLANLHDKKAAMAAAVAQSRATHSNEAVLQASELYSKILFELIHNKGDRDKALSDINFIMKNYVENFGQASELGGKVNPDIVWLQKQTVRFFDLRKQSRSARAVYNLRSSQARLPAFGWDGKPHPAGSWDIYASGELKESFNAAIWAVMSSNSFEEGLLNAVNLGGDADTVGAIAGQMLGAIYGVELVPKKWHQEIPWSKTIQDTAKALALKNQLKFGVDSMTENEKKVANLLIADVKSRLEKEPFLEDAADDPVLGSGPVLEDSVSDAGAKGWSARKKMGVGVFFAAAFIVAGAGGRYVYKKYKAAKRKSLKDSK